MFETLKWYLDFGFWFLDFHFIVFDFDFCKNLKDKLFN